MALTDQLDRELVRARIFLAFVVVCFLFLAAALWRIQVFKAAEYRTSQSRQSIRRVRLPAVRGKILDRNGRRLADNRPSYCIGIYVEELRQPGRLDNTVDKVAEVVTNLAPVLGFSNCVSRTEIRDHIWMRRPLPFLAWEDIGDEALARWAESGLRYPGVDIYVEPVRVYPHGSLAAHVLGYVVKTEYLEDPSRPYNFYLPEMVGKAGVEKDFNDRLAGEAGGRLLRVDASLFKYAEIGERPTMPGKDLSITIDVAVQEATEEALGDVMGAAVVLDPRNGDVLALASSPSYNPNVFSPSISPEQAKRLDSDPRHPFFDRAVSGSYPPGSTFKPVVAIAALENHRATPSTEFRCAGVFHLGNAEFKCWSRSGHGRINMRKAIEQSCNVYFYQLGLQCGYERIYHMAEALGLGRKSGIALPAETSGLLPNDAWKRKRYDGDGWRAGDTCNASIGQGALAFTPIQMAVVVSAIANGGYVYRPRIVSQPGVPGELVNNMRWSAETLECVRGGMYDVVQAPTGTGKRAAVEGTELGGKTGTAQYGPPGEGKTHTWMIAFAPFSAPRYAIAMIVEDGLSGGRTVAPKIHELVSKLVQM